jgi:hypothetical protein
MQTRVQLALETIGVRKLDGNTGECFESLRLCSDDPFRSWPFPATDAAQPIPCSP